MDDIWIWFRKEKEQRQKDMENLQKHILKDINPIMLDLVDEIQKEFRKKS